MPRHKVAMRVVAAMKVAVVTSPAMAKGVNLAMLANQHIVAHQAIPHRAMTNNVLQNQCRVITV